MLCSLPSIIGLYYLLRKFLVLWLQSHQLAPPPTILRKGWPSIIKERGPSFLILHGEHQHSPPQGAERCRNGQVLIIPQNPTGFHLSLAKPFFTQTNILFKSISESCTIRNRCYSRLSSSTKNSFCSPQCVSWWFSAVSVWECSQWETDSKIKVLTSSWKQPSLKTGDERLSFLASIWDNSEEPSTCQVLHKTSRGLLPTSLKISFPACPALLLFHSSGVHSEGPPQ